MTSLAESNPYLRDREERRRLITERAWQSAVFEGARGLPRPVPAATRRIGNKRRQQTGSDAVSL